MRWSRQERSKNLEDHRGVTARRRGRGMKIGGIGGGVVAIIAVLLFGPEAMKYFGGGSSGGGGGQSQVGSSTGSESGGAIDPATDSERDQVDFVNFVLIDTQKTWREELFPKLGKRYRDAKLRLFRNNVDSVCGFASSAMGPFYCGGEDRVFIDLAFFDDLRTKLKARGDFAQAYVIAHEIAHHVQNQFGTSGKVHAEQRRMPKSEANEMSVRLELQADCYAGIWAHSAAKRGIMERGDIEEGITAAIAIGDDTLQRNATGRVSPESWTHGSSEQRARWLTTGYKTGSVEACDTFATDRL